VWDTKLQLVALNILVQILAEKLDLHGLLVGNAKVAYLPGRVQDVESLSYFLRFYQCIRAVEQQNIKVIRLQPLERAIHAF